MKRVLQALLIVLLTATFASAGTWYKCDGSGKKFRGTQPPHNSVSFGTNTLPEQYANAGWCPQRILDRPELPEGHRYVKLPPVINYPYADIAWTTEPDPNAPTLKKRKTAAIKSLDQKTTAEIQNIYPVEQQLQLLVRGMKLLRKEVKKTATTEELSSLDSLESIADTMAAKRAEEEDKKRQINECGSTEALDTLLQSWQPDEI